MDKPKYNVIIILFLITMIINITEIIFRISKTNRYQEDAYLCHVLKGELTLNSPWIEKNEKIKVHYIKTFLDYGSLEILLYVFRFLSFFICSISSYFMSNFDDINLNYYISYFILLNIIIFGVFTWCSNIVKIFIFMTNNMLNERFILIYEDQISKKNGIFCFISDCIIFIIICVICYLFDIQKKDDNTINNDTDDNFKRIAALEMSNIMNNSNKIDIEELDKSENMKSVYSFNSK